MAINMTPTAMLGETYHEPVRALRWGAILAGLAVGIATNLFLVLLGAAAGLAMFGTGTEPGGNNTIPLAVAIWNTVSMIVAAFAGGYVAARSAGMRRSSDGILHGVVAWGVTLLISVFFLSSLAGATVGAMFGMSAPVDRATSSEIVGSIDQGNRQEAINVMRQRLGLSNEQASRMVDQALVLSGQANAAAPQNREAARDTLRTASIASGWLSAAIFLSLFSAIGGGVLGARGARRDVRTPPTPTVVHTKRTDMPVV